MHMNTMKNNKLPSRESETREKTSQRKPWAPPSQLDAPPAPAGFTHRWIRAESVGQMDQKMYPLDYAKDGNLFVQTNMILTSGPILIQVHIKVL